MFGEKMWGNEPFWGLGAEWDPQWLLTDRQKKLQADLIELCRTTLRENAVESDKKLLYPRKNFQAMAKLGLLGLIVPKELGGMGENHVCAAMAVETIARYGCAVHRHVLHHAPGRRRRRAVPLSRQSSPCRTSSRASTRTAWSARCPTPIPRPARHFWYPMSSGAEADRRTAGR